VTLRIKLFGPLEVETDERVLGPRDFGGVKPKQVLEILVAEGGRSVSKDRLADLLWGDKLPRNVSATLETYVSVLRNRLEPGGRRETSVVITEPGAYRFDTGRAEIDLERFDWLASESQAADGLGQRRSLEEALAIVRGDVLADEPYAEWGFNLRQRYRERHLQVLLDAAEAALGDGEHMLALVRAETALGIDALCERAYRLAMLATYALGRQEDALRWFDRCATALIDELGVNPLQETEDLATAINRHDDLTDLLPASACRGRSVASWTDGAAPLVGRTAEMQRLMDVIDLSMAGSAALVLVEGEAGIGKTRLLDEVGARLDGIEVGRTRCFELEKDLPYVPVAAAFRELIGTDETEVDPANQVQALEALVDVAKRHVPFALLVDDLHFADTASIAALGYLVRRCADLPMIVVGAYRLEEVGLDHPLRRLEPKLHLQLEALTREDLAVVGAEDLFERTGGHSLFVAQWLESELPGASDDVPPSLQESAVARCQAAGPYGFQVLLTASVFPGPFEAEAVAAVMGDDAGDVVSELERLIALRLLNVDGSSFAFRYALVQQALADTLSPARRRLLVQRMTEAGANEPTALQRRTRRAVNA